MSVDSSCGHYLGKGGQAKINATAHVYWHWCHRKLDFSINGYNVANGLNALPSLSLHINHEEDLAWKFKPPSLSMI